jgi:hypothetical protein
MFKYVLDLLDGELKPPKPRVYILLIKAYYYDVDILTYVVMYVVNVTIV